MTWCMMRCLENHRNAIASFKRQTTSSCLTYTPPHQLFPLSLPFVLVAMTSIIDFYRDYLSVCPGASSVDMERAWHLEIAERQRVAAVAGGLAVSSMSASSNKRKLDAGTTVALSKSVRATPRLRSAPHRRCCESARSSGGRRSCRSDDRDSGR
jgi:hypothetical protein